MRLAVALLSIAFATSAFSAEHTAGEIQASISKAVIFSILPNDDGAVANCEVDHALDRATNTTDSAFQPSGQYTSDACRKLSKARWNVSKDGHGAVQKVYYPCMWSPLVPDNAICPAALGE